MNSTLEFYRRLALAWAAEKITPSETETDPASYETKIRLLRSAGMSLGHNVIIMPRLRTINSLRHLIRLDDFVAVGSDVKIWSFNTVQVGKFSVIGSGATLVAGGHDPETFEPTSGPINIGNGCWIGLGVRILAGVRIGNNALIRPGSLVNCDVPDQAVVEGIPGRVVGSRDLPEEVPWVGKVKFSPQTFTRIG